MKTDIIEPKGILLLSPTPLSISSSEISKWRQEYVVKRGSSLIEE